MTHPKFLIGFLIVSGLIGLYVGTGLLFFPAELQAQSNIIIGSNSSHFSETRAPGAAIFTASLIMILSVFKPALRYFSVSIAALFFMSYGLGRLLSLVLDGMPADPLFYAMIGELVVGALAIALLVQLNKTETA